jgi:hypothetical protein
VLYLLARDKLSIVIDLRTLTLLTHFMRQALIAQPEKCIDADYAKTHTNVWLLLTEWHNQVTRLAILFKERDLHILILFILSCNELILLIIY